MVPLLAALSALATAHGCAYELADPPAGQDASSEPVRSVWLEGPDGSRRLVGYKEVGGFAIADGDIILGRIEDIEASLDGDGLIDKGTFTVAAGSFWANATVKYGTASLALNLPAAQADMVRQAMTIWTNATGVVFKGYDGRIPVDPATGQVVTDYVAFTTNTDGVCSSSVGRTGSLQWVSLSSGCGVKEIVHELGHTLGLFHEQIRLDRGNYVEVYEGNIDPDYFSANYDTWVDQGAAGLDVARHTTCTIPAYNFDSAMHYYSYTLADGDWPAMLRKADSTFDGPATKIYRLSSLDVWTPHRDTGISNTELGYGLFDTDAKTDLFRSNGSDWFFSSSGSETWTDINTSSYVYRKARASTKLLLGDFDGNGRTDTLREASDRWYVAWNGRGGWQVLNNDSKLNGSPKAPKSLATGDFNGDEKTDILAHSNGSWYVRYGGTGSWELYADNATDMPAVWEVGYGDFNGDDITDIFRVDGDNWQIYIRNPIFTTIGTWENYLTGQTARGPLAQNATVDSWSNSVALGDFSGDGLTDVLTTWPTGIYYAATSLGPFGEPSSSINVKLGKSLTPLHFGNFNLNFVHTCKTLSAGSNAGQRRCHSGPDVNGDGITDLMSSQLALAEPSTAKPTLGRADIWAVCSRYPALGGKCASGGNWTVATCPVNIP